MSARPFVLGLTGSIGMGKSTVAAMFREEGVPVFDADAEVHRLQGPGGALVAAIEAEFPETTKNGAVDRAALREVALRDSGAMTRLEALIHPAVGRARAAFLEANREALLVLLDIPLLFEASGWRDVDAIAVVSASPEIQRARVLARADMTEERFESILARQLPDAEKRARADHVIATDVPFEETRARVRHLIACLTPRMGG